MLLSKHHPPGLRNTKSVDQRTIRAQAQQILRSSPWFQNIILP